MISGIRARTLFAACVALACGDSTSPGGRFGSQYRVMLDPDRPALGAANVSITVSYGGCRGNHVFVLRSRLDGGMASIWLQKITPDEMCDMLVVERRTFGLPASAFNATSVMLLAPEIDPVQLRP
jgi:hypothetical protein